MILHTIEVQGWRCFADPLEVGPLSEQLNVLHAPNGMGKSKLLEAVMRACFDSHRVTGRDIESIRPWGRRLAPEVAVGFSCDGTTYRLEKRFLDGPRSVLKRRENGRLVRFAEGDHADEHVRGLLLASAPGRGASKPAHWGLAQVLWVPQGEMAFADLSGDVIEGIRDSLGAQVSGDGARGIEKGIEDLYTSIFTATGRLRGGRAPAPVVELEARVAQGIERVREARARWEAFEEASRRIQDLTAQRRQAAHDLEELRGLIAEGRARASLYDKLLQRRELARVQWEKASAEERALREQMDRIEDLNGRLTSQTEQIASLESLAPALGAEREAAADAVRTSQDELARIRGQRTSVEEVRETAREARRYLDLKQQIGRGEELEKRAKKEAVAVEGLREALANQVAPERKELAKIRRAIAKRNELRTKLDAALITLEVEPLTPGSMEVLDAESPGVIELLPGRPVQVRGAPEVALKFGELAWIRARAATESVPELRRKVRQAEQSVKELVLPFGNAELEALEELGERRERLAGKLNEAETRLETLLDGVSLTELASRLARGRASLAEILEGRGEWTDADPDADALERGSKDLAKRHQREEQTAEQEAASAGETRQAIGTRWDELTTDLRVAKRDRDRTATELKEACSDGRTEPERQREVREARHETQRRSEELEEAEEELARYDGDPRDDLRRLEEQLDASEAGERKLLEEEKEQAGRLQELSAADPYTALARAEEQLDRIGREHELEHLRTEAIRLLHEMVTTLRSEAIASVALPVERRASQIFQRIAGRRLGQVRLSEGFDPLGMRAEPMEAAIALEDLSGGEREQLHLAVRLALAEVIGREERQLLVLDDVLTATDTARLARVHRVLEEAAESHQVLILTCHPERYRALRSAEFIDLRAKLLT